MTKCADCPKSEPCYCKMKRWPRHAHRHCLCGAVATHHMESRTMMHHFCSEHKPDGAKKGTPPGCQDC